MWRKKDQLLKYNGACNPSPVLFSTIPNSENADVINVSFKNLFYIPLRSFEVVIGGRRYFAFLTYKEVLKDVIVSICNVTYNGWFHDNVDLSAPEFPVKNWGCYFGKTTLHLLFINRFSVYCVSSIMSRISRLVLC